MYAVSKKAFGPSKTSQAAKALSGLAQGIINGISAQEQLRNGAAQRAALAQRMQLMQSAEARQQKADARVDTERAATGEAMRGAFGAGGQTNGQAGGQALGEQGSPAPSQDPEAVDNERFSQVLSELGGMLPDDVRREFVSVAIGEQKQKKIAQSVQQLDAQINDRMLMGAYDLPDFGVAPIETGPDGKSGKAQAQPGMREAAQALRDQLKLAAKMDPDQAAQLIDYVFEQDHKLRMHAVEHGLRMSKRMRTSEDLDAQIQQLRAGSAPGVQNPGIQETEALKFAYQHDLIDDATLGKELPDALLGVGAMKKQLQAAQAEAAMGRAFMNSPEGIQFAARQKAEDAQAAEAQRQSGRESLLKKNQAGDIKLQGVKDKAAKERLILPKPKTGSTRGPLADEKDISSIMGQEFPLGRELSGDGYKTREGELRGKVGEKPADSQEKLIQDIKAGAIKDEAELTKRAQALGLSPAQLEKLLGG